jgi:hypothetical protein
LVVPASSKPATQYKPLSGPAKPNKPDTKQDELDAMMIAQMLEEDESRLLAEQLQNEMYGGQQRPNSFPQSFENPPVRDAQPQVIQ